MYLKTSQKRSMLGVFVIIVVSWLLLWIISKEHITVLGLIPNKKRIKQFALGFSFMAIACSINLGWQAHFKEVSYAINPNYNFTDALYGFWWTLKAVLFEEFIFRGVLLLLLIRRIGILKACLIDALIFGIYHWFSYDMFGRGVIPMTYVLLVTGSGGWMFAFAFAKTKSILTPIGLHFGWIFVSIVIFSAGPLGNQFLIPSSGGSELGGWATLLFFLFQAAFVPGIVTWYLYKNTLASTLKISHKK